MAWTDRLRALWRRDQLSRDLDDEMRFHLEMRTSDNVAAGITLVRPDAIDISSGVESEPGVKDHALMERLFERVRRSSC